MAVRLSGMISGLDTDALVQELVSAYSKKKESYEKEKTKLEWTQDAWKSLNTKTYSFYTSKLSNMRFSSTYSKKSATSSNTSKATVTASSTAVNGTQSLKISNLATTGYLTGAELRDKNDTEKKASYKGNTKLSELGVSEQGNISVKVNGKEHSFAVNGDTTINQVVVQLKTAGLNASFDEANQRFFVSSTTSGKDHDFALIGDTAGVKALKDMGLYSVSASDKAYYETIANSDVEKLALNEYLKQRVKEENAVLSEANENYRKELAYLEDKTNKDSQLAEKITEVNNKLLEKLNVSYEDLIQNRDAETGEITHTAYTAIADETLKGEIDALIKEADGYAATKAEYDEYTQNMSGTTVEDRIAELEQTVEDNTATMKANSSLASKTYTVEEFADNQDLANMVKGYNSTEPADQEAKAAYDAIYKKYEEQKGNAEKILQEFAAGTVNGGSDNEPVRINGEDSKIELNGAVFTSNTNNYSINGLTITALAETQDGEALSITTETDVGAIYDMVKDFVKSYNDLMKEMQTAYNADSAKGYEPLTDEEKEAMSDDEVEKWEKKVKDALLRRDDTLGNIVSAMQTAMSRSYKVGDKTYNLTSFGIGTGSYFTTDKDERGCLHIDGDKDDAVTSGNSDKLRKAIASDPETFVSAFSQIANGLYSELTKKMSRSTLSSAYTIYNDKYMKTQQDELEDTIEKWEERLTDIEDKYYKQFSAMESAMAELQSQTTALSGLLGA